MSNPEKAPQYSAGDQHGSGLLPTAQPGQQYPPSTHDSSAPPAYNQGSAELPGDEKPRVPVPQQDHSQFAGAQQQPPQFAPPPVGESQQQPLAGDEKRKLEQQYFPPPPPGPPPSQDQHQQSAAHPNPLQGNPITEPQQHQETHQPFDAQHTQQGQQSQQNYAIPQYDPAHPTFAPPPTGEPVQSGTTVPDPSHSHDYNQGHVQGHVQGHDHNLGHVQGSDHGHGQGHVPDTGNVSTFVPPEEHKKPGWSERFSQLGIKAAAPINSLAHKFGSQSFLPETIDKECDKAASILKSFCSKSPHSTQITYTHTL